ncbi:hypothetical protein B0I32_12557 [Nonomuraea fuscirosea]|uniref:Uncharacterized protein n=1 Tax=Nonomuraea fuscirosea TaxID=1291556 RepID=A0A2T0ME67_9ACTN|nr:hypothetical protein [Nonomuraea fuscirosea]PRX55837.1 hypothetical protein B0I32_12557 [Nonomuraea fuscirosea]
MSFGAFARKVRDPALPHRRVSALRSCVQLYRPIGFEATLSFLHAEAGPFRTDEAAHHLRACVRTCLNTDGQLPPEQRRLLTVARHLQVATSPL